jgi:UDP-N-acetylmuramoyl-tripeptide--D-alanyl-D-alanine ligase
MEYFGTLDAVAEEELASLKFSERALINIDDTAAEYLAKKEFASYGLSPGANYRVVERSSKDLRGQDVVFHLGSDNKKIEFSTSLLGEHGAKIALAAAAVADMLGIQLEDIKTGVESIAAFAGRMQILDGVKNSIIIDDTYNSSPVAVEAALDVLQNGDAPQRIFIMGSMNELGDSSPEAHRQVAEHCDPTKIDLIVTIGVEAKEFFAPTAKQQGCTVKTFLDPYKAGNYVKKNLQENAVILAKGSQNGVFAEEAVKQLLANKPDEQKLVRQSSYWLARKRKQFPS